MADSLQDSFEEMVPGAADKGGLFLQVIRDRASQENIGLTFIVRQLRKNHQTVLEATIQLGGTFIKGPPMKIIVYAEPVGSLLQVGWQLTQEELPTIFSMSSNMQMQHDRQSLRNYTPDNQRKLNGLIQAFHLSTFLPVLRMLVDAIESSSRPQGGEGFLGAN